MKHSYRLAPSIAMLSLICLAAPRAAHAYVDPGTGSYFLQLGMAAALGTLYSLKLYWRQVWSCVARRGTRRPVGSE